jgi:hypothetical protein
MPQDLWEISSSDFTKIKKNKNQKRARYKGERFNLSLDNNYPRTITSTILYSL